MTETLMHGSHLEDGELLRYFDDEAEHGDRAAAERHLAACGECRARLETLQRRSHAVTATLRAADIDPPPVRLVEMPRRPFAWLGSAPLKAAAVIVALLGGALTVSPVRAWLVDRWNDVRTVLADEQTAPEPVPAADEQGAASVAFVPAPGAFVVRIAASQLAGRLSAVMSGDSVASARVIGGAGAIDLVVLPDGLVIRNDSSARASYALRLPDAVTELVVEIVGRAAVRVGAEALAGGGWSIELGR